MDRTDETRLLQDLLADAHTRIRELQSSRDCPADELLTLTLNDRRRPVGSPGNVESERRHGVLHAAVAAAGDRIAFFGNPAR